MRICWQLSDDGFGSSRAPANSVRLAVKGKRGNVVESEIGEEIGLQEQADRIPPIFPPVVPSVRPSSFFRKHRYRRSGGFFRAQSGAGGRFRALLQHGVRP